MTAAEPTDACAENSATLLPAVALLHDRSCDTDALLLEVARDLQARGLRVRGLCMTYPDRGSAEGCAGSMVLVDLSTGDEYLVSQPLGRDSKACRGDPQGFARASQVLRRALDEQPDLVVCNRFGEMEAAGRGFSNELLELLAAGHPLLTAVAPQYQDAWQRFTGGAAVLPARREAIDAWLASIGLGAAVSATAG
ncbi:MAG: DUF2478 domain-containing protein [Leptothrix sp. (in: Bacteria)]|nr:DUF2478 domain-containing protein [Leptothrix sp. (in: b-proteobacteria)]